MDNQRRALQFRRLISAELESRRVIVSRLVPTNCEVVESFGASLAENENSARTLSFDKNHRMFRENRGMFYLVERFDGLRGEIAEKTEGTQMAIKKLSQRSSIRTHSLALLHLPQKHVCAAFGGKRLTSSKDSSLASRQTAPCG
jgi:hypothetical protein